MKKCKHRTHRQYADYRGNSSCLRCTMKHPDAWKWKLQLFKTGAIKLEGD